MELDAFIESLDEEQINILSDLILRENGFSVDWFPERPSSKLFGIVLKLYQQKWINLNDTDSSYSWTSTFPRMDFLARVKSQKAAHQYCNVPSNRKAHRHKKKYETSRSPQRGRHQRLTQSEILSMLDRAEEKEKGYKLVAAVSDYDAVIDLLFSAHESAPLPEDLKRAFIHAVEKRAGLSIFFPKHEKVISLLLAARKMAKSLNDKRLQASLELIVGQHYWVSLRVHDAMSHLKHGWSMVQELNDVVLERQSLKLKSLSYVSQGRLFKAIEQHERFIGNIESFDDDFSLFAGLGLSFVYTEAGMPQRGLGICEAIRKQCDKHENKPLLSLSFSMSGAILLEIGQIKRSKICFEKADAIARGEKIQTIELLAKTGRICVACLEGNRDIAFEVYETIQGTSKLSWYYFLNFSAFFETFYRLFGKDVLSGDSATVDFLSQIKTDDLFPMAAHMVQRLRIVLSEGGLSSEEKIAKLSELEAIVQQDGATFELAKIRIEIARLYINVNRRDIAENYAKEAWQFFRSVARNAFPGDLLYLLPRDDLSEGGSLSELVIEMGKALATQDNLEELLTNIITSLSQMTGSERSAIFIKDPDSSEIRMIASRNLYNENILEEEFRSGFDAVQSVFQNGNNNIFGFKIRDSELIDERKAVVVPLMLKDQIAGVFYQDSRFFSLDTTPEGINVLSALASQVALAIDRARAYDEIAKLNKRLIQENLYYLDEKEEFRPFGEIIGSSNGIMDVQRLIRKVAPTQSAVLIQGETGVGKEMVARAIHRESSRKDKPFIRVNCAALPDSLIDSELFGHEKGAFTGAIKSKEGRFELAHEGTIFLDEVSELPLSTQSRLLRVLQEKEFQRVGGTKTLHSDFRLITATNKDLKKEVEAGRFREDLFYRLNVYPILVPSLRERQEDIPALATHFLRLFSAQSNKAYAGITIAEMEKLKTYAWPGNIRELSNIIERAVVSDVKPRFTELTGARAGKGEWCGLSYGTLNYKEVERQLILEALNKSGGVVGGKGGAAELMGINRTTLIFHMKKLGIKVEHQRTFRHKKT